MYKTAIELLNVLHNNRFDAYIVGGYVRDKLLNIESNDIDIATNATIEDLKKIFKSVKYLNYGSCKLKYLNYEFEVTTFRCESNYNKNRWPKKVEYKDTLIEDLKRRDFTINTICINYKEEYIDYLNGIEDLNNKIIKSVGNSFLKMKEDSLRILRAIRFASILNFKLDKELENSIKMNSQLLDNLSFYRKKDELNRIFSSPNALYGINLLNILELDKILKIEGLNNIKYTSNYLGIWAQLKYSNDYNFTRKEKRIINNIRYIVNNGIIDEYTLYKYTLEENIISGEILNIKNNLITKIYESMTIYKRKDIKIDLNKVSYIPKNKINEIYIDLEKKILYNKIINEEEKIIEYLNNKYRK